MKKCLNLKILIVSFLLLGASFSTSSTNYLTTFLQLAHCRFNEKNHKPMSDKEYRRYLELKNNLTKEQISFLYSHAKSFYLYKGIDKEGFDTVGII
jgi:hypothetical protein